MTGHEKPDDIVYDGKQLGKVFFHPVTTPALIRKQTSWNYIIIVRMQKKLLLIQKRKIWLRKRPFHPTRYNINGSLICLLAKSPPSSIRKTLKLDLGAGNETYIDVCIFSSCDSGRDTILEARAAFTYHQQTSYSTIFTLSFTVIKDRSVA